MPTTLKQFKNPPIKEAIFAIAFADPVAADRLSAFTESSFVKGLFSEVLPNMKVELKADTKAQSLTASTSADGYDFRTTTDRKRIIRVLTTQLSYHDLSAYNGWEGMMNELKKLWAEFCQTVGKTKLSQLSVRYINHIGLPRTDNNVLADYLRMLPQIPDGINPDISNFYVEIQVPVAANINAVVRQTVLPATETLADRLGILLDISVSKSGAFECNEQDMWAAFEELRGHKNQIFTSCLTENALNLFN